MKLSKSTAIEVLRSIGNVMVRKVVQPGCPPST
jgi:hypothetical protein